MNTSRMNCPCGYNSFLKIVNTELRKTVGYCFPESGHKKLYAVTEYDIFLWHGMVEFVTVYGKDDIRFTMKDGTEIRV